MNILVVSESFNNGGLETQIKTMHDNTINSRMIFAFGKYSNKIDLNDAKIYKDFHFSYDSTIKDFCEDVDRLVELIQKERIDVIHVHPYYSFFPAFIASQLTNIKLVYTHHGIGSFTFTKSVNGAILFYYAITEKCVSNIFSVNEDGVNIFKKLNYSNVVLLPNPIDVKLFKKANVVNNRKWALISRLDQDKYDEIKIILQNLDKYNIEKIDIYGDGSLKDDLIDFINKSKLNDTVSYKGYLNNIFESLNNNYNGVIGIGRVLLESLTMGYPSIIIGYKKITGYVNYDVYNDIKSKNFINMKYNKTNDKYPSPRDIKMIRSDIIKKFNVDSVIKKYEKELERNNSFYFTNIKELYSKIKDISKNELLMNCSFFKERVIYKLLVKYISYYSSSAIVDTLIANADLTYDILDVSFNRIQELKGDVKNEN